MRNIVVLVLLLSGCASHAVRNTWTPQRAWYGSGTSLQSKDGPVTVNPAKTQELLNAYTVMSAVSGIKTTLAIIDLDMVNAFAQEVNGVRYMYVTLQMIDKLDRDAMAHMIGHELAHLQYGHKTSAIEYERMADRQGFEWMLRGQLDPCGAVRAVSALTYSGGNHQGNEERIQMASQYAKRAC